MKRNCGKILSFVLALSMVLSNCPTALVNTCTYCGATK